MNTEDFGSIVRLLLNVGAGFVLSKGWADANTVNMIAGGLLPVLTGLWTLKSNHRRPRG